MGALLEEGRQRLLGKTDQPSQEAQILLSHSSGLTHAQIIANPDHSLSEKSTADFTGLIDRRVNGEPIAYLCGAREFWSLKLTVSKDVLIPRPETELLVERTLIRMALWESPVVADLGTGSGAVALALAKESPPTRIIATDRSDAALGIARQNSQQLGINNVEFYCGRWFDALGRKLKSRINIIASNPPYVMEGDPHLLQGDLPWEPRQALISGRDGLAAFRTIISEAPRWLTPSGWLLLEHGPAQQDHVRVLMEEAGFLEIMGHSDLAGLPRVTEGQLPPPSG